MIRRELFLSLVTEETMRTYIIRENAIDLYSQTLTTKAVSRVFWDSFGLLCLLDFLNLSGTVILFP